MEIKLTILHLDWILSFCGNDNVKELLKNTVNRSNKKFVNRQFKSLFHLQGSDIKFPAKIRSVLLAILSQSGKSSCGRSRRIQVLESLLQLLGAKTLRNARNLQKPIFTALDLAWRLFRRKNLCFLVQLVLRMHQSWKIFFPRVLCLTCKVLRYLYNTR